MDEYACPAVIDTPTGNLTDLVVDNAAEAPARSSSAAGWGSAGSTSPAASS